MLNTATSYLALLSEDDIQLKSIALEKLNLLIDDQWSVISDKIRELKNYYESKTIPGKEELIALILSKLYYNLEQYENAIEWALKSGKKFNISERNLYVSTILKKILDKYISIRKQNFNKDNENKKEIDERIVQIVETIFSKCLEKNEAPRAIGFAIESYDLDKLVKSVETCGEIGDNLDFVYELCQDFVDDIEYKNSLLEKLLELYIKHKKNEFMSITNCQFLLNNTEALSNTLIKILNEDKLNAYQIAFDLYDNQNPSYLREIKNQIKLKNNENNNNNLINKEDFDNLLKILNGEIQKKKLFNLLNLSNKTDPNVLKGLIKSVEKGGSVTHLGVILCNSLLNSHTGNDSFLKDNLDWVSKATNWARFITTSSIGVIHMNNIEKGYDIIKQYLPGGSLNQNSIYAQGGAFYGLGLIYFGTNDEKILKIFNDALNAPGNKKETVQHGIYLGIGLVAFGTKNKELYERLREGLYIDDAVVGEAAGYAIGLVMAGSKDSEAIDDLLKYAHDTQHEKIIRAISITLSLIVYGIGNNADTLIETLIREKDPILRYGAMYCIGMAYAGSGNTTMLQKLIKISVSDVSDDVRRAALINIGFLMIKNPEILFEKLKVIQLLSESYNSHVRYGAALAIGISNAGSSRYLPYKTIQPLFGDPNYLVRQSALISSALIFSQTTLKQEPNINIFKDSLEKNLNGKDEHVLIRFGALLSKGLLELGGKNASISLVSNTGENKMSSIIGMCLFTQYYYWFPMIHFINLAVNPTMLIGLDNTMHPPKNYKVLSKSKPSIFGYPVEDKEKEKAKQVKTEVAVLSTHSRVKAKERKTGTVTMTDVKASGVKNKDSSNIQELKDAPSGKIPTDEKNEENKNEEKKEEEKKEEEKKEEPNEEIIENPIRILPKQKNVIEEIPDLDYSPIVKGRLNGFVMLMKKKDDAVVDYGDFKDVVVMGKKEEKKEDNKSEEKKEEYKAVPTEDYEIPEDVDMENIK